MTRLEYLFNQYGNILDWYKQSETKSTFLVSINTVIVGAVNGLVFVAVDKVAAVGEVYSALLWFLLALCGLTLVGSYMFILKAVWARHRGEAVDLTNEEKLWFFGHVALMSQAQHKAMVGQFSGEHLEATMTAQNFILSRNVAVKYDALNKAITLTIVSLVLLFALGIAYATAVANVPLQLSVGAG